MGSSQAEGLDSPNRSLDSRQRSMDTRQRPLPASLASPRVCAVTLQPASCLTPELQHDPCLSGTHMLISA